MIDENSDFGGAQRQPLISVVIPTRHRLALLRRAIASIDSQTYRNIEVVIVDNCSDFPLKPADFSTSCQLKIQRIDQIMSAACNRNAGVDVASGEFICFLDDDDTYAPNKMGDQIKYFQDNPHADYCYADTLHIDQRGAVMGLSSGEPDAVSFLRWRYIHPNTLMVKKSVLTEHRFDETMTTFEDVDLAGRLVIHCRGGHLPVVHSYWNRDNRPDQLSGRNWYRSYFNWKKLCLKFRNEIESERGIAFYYHRKMFLLSARYLDLSQFCRSLRILMSCPWLPRKT